MRQPSSWLEPIRTALKRGRSMPHAAAGFVAVVLIAVVAADAIGPRPHPDPDSSGPAPSGAPRSTPGAQPSAGSWAHLQVPAFNPLADLSPIDTDASGVSTASAFLLHSRTATPAAVLATGLEAEPAFEFAVEPGSSAADARIVPTAPLAAGIRYRFRVSDATGRLLGTWTYRTGQPLHVVQMLPGDRSIGVPLDTGIEITFDQDGPTGLPSHFSIVPAIPGTFHTVARTVVFSPTQPLVESTIYRVIISAGVGMTGSDQTLEAPASWAFETRGPTAPDPFDAAFGRPILEVSPSQPAIFGLDAAFAEGPSAPKPLPLRVYRLPTIAAARNAAARLLTDPGWAQLDTTDLVSTAGLTQVLAIDAVPEVQSQWGFSVVRLPAPLAVGWYLVVIPREGRDRQALLQVTDLAAWAMTSETRTLAWIHDLATGEPIPGAQLIDAAGAVVGSTNEGGLIDVSTPTSLRPTSSERYGARPTIATLASPDGRRLLVVLGTPTTGGGYMYERNDLRDWVSPSERWWLLLSTDRTTYRTTDTIHAWGLLRSRDDGTVPAQVSIRLRSTDASEDSGPWLAQTSARPTARGTWAVDLPLSNVPYGDYIVDVRTAGAVVGSVWVGVREIRKPAYSLDVTVDRHAVFAGDAISATAQVNFFDGTPYAGLGLLADGLGNGKTVTTDSTGTARFTVTAGTSTAIGFGSESVDIRPVHPEEGQIGGGANMIVFPSAAWFDASATIIGSRAVLTGRLSRVDLAAVERQLATNGWPEDPAGAALGGRTITVAVIELVPVTRQVGTTYDFIEKRVVPILETTTTERRVGTYTTSSAKDGAISFANPIPDASHTYRLILTTRDAAGRLATAETYASIRVTDTSRLHPYLDQGGSCGYVNRTVPVGERVAITMYEGDGSASAPGQYLFVVAARGIREAVLQASSTLETTMAVADLPSLNIIAVRFSSSGYFATNEILLRAEPDTRTLKVMLTTDRVRYAPGETATIEIRTTAPDGTPVGADVVVRGVDEKLYTLGSALDIDALATLLQPVTDGLLQSATSHVVPVPSSDGCGDTTGGRDDFRDSVIFKLVATNAQGMGTVTFPLPDDITSWHLSATAVDDQLRAGDGSVLVPVGLPFFADAIIAPEFLTGERPILQVRSAGDQLASGDRVRYTISAPSLLLPPTVVEAAASATASLPLPSLPFGSHDITIEATVIGKGALHDALVRRISVRTSRVAIRTSATVDPADPGSIGGSGLTSYVITDAGRGSLLPVVSAMAEATGARFDRALSADIARILLLNTYGMDVADVPPATFDVTRWERQGIALLPYSSADLGLTALAAVVAPEYLDRLATDQALNDWANVADTTRERRIIALAGRAGLGSDVVDELDGLDALDHSPLSVRESLWLGLGYLASGDETTARMIENQLLTEQGEELGPWARLRAGSTLADTVEATSLLALIAAGVGDPLAPRLIRYLEDNPVPTFLPVLHEVGAIRWMLERMPRDRARFAWVVDGLRADEVLEAGQSRTLTLTSAQRAGLRVQSLEGKIAVIATWSTPAGESTLPTSDLVEIRRTVTPADDAGSTDIVHVRIQLTFSAQAPAGCYDVTDTTPSGLAPLSWAPGWDANEDVTGTGLRPWAVDGQRISWCIDPVNLRTPVLIYSARVVSPGTFRWEPALVQAAAAPTIGASTAPTSYTIR